MHMRHPDFNESKKRKGKKGSKEQYQCQITNNKYQIQSPGPCKEHKKWKGKVVRRWVRGFMN